MKTLGEGGWQAWHKIATSEDLPTIPTNLSSFTNDVGYLTEHQDLSNYVVKDGTKKLSTNDFTNALKNKLDGIAAGAEVNVQSDWNQTDTTADDFIKNKPTIPENTDHLVTQNQLGTTNATKYNIITGNTTGNTKTTAEVRRAANVGIYYDSTKKAEILEAPYFKGDGSLLTNISLSALPDSIKTGTYKFIGTVDSLPTIPSGITEANAYWKITTASNVSTMSIVTTATTGYTKLYVGDVINVKESNKTSSDGDGPNYAWTGTGWDSLGGIYGTATINADGLMSSADKTKLDGIASGATANIGTVTTVKYSSTATTSAQSTNGFTADGSGNVTLGAAGTTYYGITRLSSSTDSISEVLAATPKAVNEVYKLASGKQEALDIRGSGVVSYAKNATLPDGTTAAKLTVYVDLYNESDFSWWNVAGDLT